MQTLSIYVVSAEEISALDAMNFVEREVNKYLSEIDASRIVSIIPNTNQYVDALENDATRYTVTVVVRSE